MMRSRRRRMLVGIAASTVIFTGIGLWLTYLTKDVDKPELCADETPFYAPQVMLSEHKDLYDPLCKEYDKGGNCIEVVPEWEEHRLPHTVWGYIPQFTPLPEPRITPSSRYRPAPRSYGGGGGNPPRIRVTTTPPGNKVCDVPEPSIFWLVGLGLAGLVSVRWASKNN